MTKAVSGAKGAPPTAVTDNGRGTARFEAAAAAIDQPLLVVLPADGSITYANQRARKVLKPLFGPSPVGRAITELLALDPAAAALVAEASASEQGRIRDLPLTLMLPGGHVRSLSLSVEPFTEDGVASAVVTWADITPLRMAEAEMVRSRELVEAANQAKSEFLARMSHELRTPLNAIIGFAEMLYQQVFGPLGNAKYREYASDIHESGRHLMTLINDILDMARIEVGRYDLNRRMTDPAAVVRSAQRAVARNAEERNVRLVLNVGEGLPRVYVDERALRQILINLLSNAIKFSPHGGRVELEVTGDGERFRVSVNDTGIGIGSEDLDRVLKPFERGRNIMHTEHGSVGLGLPLANNLVLMHGGRLWIDSTVGAGTRVSFEMPRVSAG